MTESDQTVLPQNEPDGREYYATADELRIIDAAVASVDQGEVASESENKAAFAKFLRE